MNLNEAGFEKFREVLSSPECDALLASLESVNRSRAGARHLMSHPAVAQLARDPRLLRIAGGAIPYRATLFDKSRASNWLVAWHQDTAIPLASRFEAEEWGPWSIKAGISYAHAPAWALEKIVALRLHLDPSTADNGPLLVIPGSHRRGVFRPGGEDKHVACVCGRGDVLAMRPLLLHSSQKAASPEPRRVLHIEYAESLDLAPGIRLAKA